MEGKEIMLLKTVQGLVLSQSTAPAVSAALSPMACPVLGLVEETRMALPFSSLSLFDDPFGGDTEVLLFLCFLCASLAAEDAG